MFQPVIKWSGSKRTQAKSIVEYFPKNIDTYYEPFLGGGSILRELLDNTSIKVKYYICSDINTDLINIWLVIKHNPHRLINSYYTHWNILNSYESIENKKEYFNKIRTKYNKYHDPEDFFFIMRTTVNGMPRYNKNGQFNNAFHVTRNGINPEKLKLIILEWNKKIQNVSFISSSYEHTQSSENDLIYLDPPYFNTKGMYYGTIDYKKFFKWMEIQEGHYILSFDGKIIDGQDMTYEVPEYLYKKRIYLKSGNSSFRRVIGKSNDSIVYESLYIK